MTEVGPVRILSWDIPNGAGGEDCPSIVECCNAMRTASDLVQDRLEKGGRKQKRMRP